MPKAKQKESNSIWKKVFIGLSGAGLLTFLSSLQQVQDIYEKFTKHRERPMDVVMGLVQQLDGKDEKQQLRILEGAKEASPYPEVQQFATKQIEEIKKGRAQNMHDIFVKFTAKDPSKVKIVPSKPTIISGGVVIGPSKIPGVTTPPNKPHPKLDALLLPEDKKN